MKYTRAGNSELVEYARLMSGADEQTQTPVLTHRAYEGTRDLFDYVENTITANPTPPLSKYDYANDADTYRERYSRRQVL